jgi:uncharacterized protein involved in outer membrane biogenesis
MASRRVTIALSAGAGAAALIAASIAAAVTLMPAIVSRVASQALPALSRELGHEVHIGSIEARLLPRPRAQITDLVIDGAPGEPPLLSAKRAYAFVALWPLLRSFGRDIVVSSAGVEGAALSIVTRADGASNLAPFAALTARPGRTLEMDLLTVRAARLDWFDLRRSDKPIAMVDQFEADVAPDRLRARGRLAADASNVDLTVALGGVVHAAFAVSRVDLARLGAALPGRMSQLVTAGELAMKGEIAGEPNGPLAVTGTGSVENLRVGAATVKAAFGLKTTVALASGAPSAIELDPLETARFTVGRVEITDVRGRATLAAEALRLDAISAKLAGAPLTIDNARVDLTKTEIGWALRGALTDADLAGIGKALGARMPVSGKLSTRFDVSGMGLEWDAIRPSLAGTGSFSIKDAAVSAETTAAIARPLRTGLDAFGLGGAFPDLGAMSIAPFGAPLHIGSGAVRLDEAVSLRTALGDTALKGKIGLDQKLALSGTATLRFYPIPGGKAHTASVPIAISGTLGSPVVAITATPAQLLGAIAGAAPSAGEIQAEALRRLRGWLDPAKR